MRWALVLIIAAGCGFSSLNGPQDGSGSGSNVIDAPMTIDTPGESIDAIDLDRDCIPMWENGSIAFYPPVPLATLNTSSVERDPFLSQDELTIYFSREHVLSGGGVDADIYTATRASVGDPFGAATTFDVVNTSNYESKMSISMDGLALIINRGLTGGGSDLYIATRANVADPWTSPTNTDVLDDVNGFYNPYDPELGVDGTRLYFAPSDGVHPQMLQLATRSDLGDSFESGDIPGITTNGNYNDADPWISGDEKLLLFSRVLVDQTDVDMQYAVKAGSSDFGAIMPVPDVNTTPTADGDPWLSPKGCRLYFASTRGGNYDLYVANAK
jgi:hypothetical protein